MASRSALIHITTDAVEISGECGSPATTVTVKLLRKDKQHENGSTTWSLAGQKTWSAADEDTDDAIRFEKNSWSTSIKPRTGMQWAPGTWKVRFTVEDAKGETEFESGEFKIVRDAPKAST